MTPEQKMVATIGLVLILFVIFGNYKSTLKGILFTPDPAPVTAASDVIPTATTPVVTGTPPTPTTQPIGLGSLPGVTV